MKKSYTLLVAAFYVLVSQFTEVLASCSYDGTGPVSEGLSRCRPTRALTASDYTLNGGIKNFIISIANNKLIVLGSLLAIGGLVFASILYVTAMGDDEKIKKAKDAMKYAIIGFVVMLVAFPLVNAIVNLVFSIGS